MSSKLGICPSIALIAHALYGSVPVAGVFISYPSIMTDKGAIDLVFLIQERILHFRNLKVRDLLVDLLSSELSIIFYALARVRVDKWLVVACRLYQRKVSVISHVRVGWAQICLASEWDRNWLIASASL